MKVHSYNNLFIGFTSIGVLLDVAVWYYGKDLNLYKDEDNDEKQTKEIKSDDK